VNFITPKYERKRGNKKIQLQGLAKRLAVRLAKKLKRKK